MPDKETDQLGQRLKTISVDLRLYVEKRIELLLLNVSEKLSRWMAESIYKLIGVFLLVTAFLFALVALAIFLGDVLDSRSLGYVAVTVLLLISGGLFYLLKPRGMLEKLENYFETEFMEVLSLDGEQEKKTEETPKLTEKQNTQP